MINTAIRYALLMVLVGGLLYPLAMTGLGQLLFPRQASGSLITSQNEKGNKTIIGSELIGQAFTEAKYFHPRPSQNNYDASNSSGSNYGPTSQKFIQRVQHDVQTYRNENLLDTNTVPVDAVTASGSGLDPEISLANAYAQAPRISVARSQELETIYQLIRETQTPKTLGIFSEPGVNVLLLNLKLDSLPTL